MYLCLSQASALLVYFLQNKGQVSLLFKIFHNLTPTNISDLNNKYF